MAALSALLGPLAGRRDVADLQRRLTEALRQPAPALALLSAATEAVTLSRQVTGERPASPPEPSPVPGQPPEERRRLRLARAALASLEQRLQQKERSCAEFRRLLAESRQQAEQQAQQHRQQLARSSDQLRQQVALVAR